MKIAVCEDEERYIEPIILYVQEWAEIKGVFTEVFTYGSAEKFLYDWEDNEDYDLIILDIKMGTITGMELAKIIRRTNKNIAIIFATNMKEYAIKGYTVDAMQFLLKPINKEDCFLCLDKVYQNDSNKKHFVFEDSDKTFRIPHVDIIYIEKFLHYAAIVTKERKYSLRKTVSQLLEDLGDSLFIRCHKSYIINIRHMEALSKNYAVLSNGEEIPISKSVVKEMNDMFYKYNVNKV